MTSNADKITPLEKAIEFCENYGLNIFIIMAPMAGACPTGLAALVPAVCEEVAIPVMVTGGIANSRGVSLALMLGASAVQIETELVRTLETSIALA